MYFQKKSTRATTGGIGHLLLHMKKCLKNDTQDISQMLLSTSQGTMRLSNVLFDLEKFQELLAASMTMHNLSFQFVE